MFFRGSRKPPECFTGAQQSHRNVLQGLQENRRNVSQGLKKPAGMFYRGSRNPPECFTGAQENRRNVLITGAQEKRLWLELFSEVGVRSPWPTSEFLKINCQFKIFWWRGFSALFILNQPSVFRYMRIFTKGSGTFFVHLFLPTNSDFLIRISL